MRRLITIPLAIMLSSCGRTGIEVPAVDGGARDLAPSYACDRSRPERPCPTGCGCEEISGLCRPIPQSPDADCRRR